VAVALGSSGGIVQPAHTASGVSGQRTASSIPFDTRASAHLRIALHF
jgi:hypothetical protein